ncbi:hypothetical protein LDVICp217 [lymphocystis disease virus-China]|uniref:Uncharacterized protein n=2 Tax=Lymphocystis disease virus 2 TaxID=159183 RepID=A0A6F8X1T9_9VIRU|nr:hypothetical protein LDVICp217 [lymphocystis disease virus-China]AAU11060.1 hypothetical protein [lymphocystis disease virus-China]BCB67540.1 hypothetical protein [Lymphocystis disease virus 2]
MELYHIITTILLTIALLFISYYYWKAVEKLNDRITTVETKLTEPTPDVEKIFETLEEVESTN